MLAISLQDWLGTGDIIQKQINLRDTVQLFCNALEEAKEHSSAFYIVGLCHSDIHVCGDNLLLSVIHEQQNIILSKFQNHQRLALLSSEAIECKFHLNNYFDVQTYKLGHIPYSTSYYSALMTQSLRIFSGQNRKPYKVIVLDCDNTLWEGLSAEDGAHNVQIKEGHRYLQQLVVDLQTKGFLLCLCSANEPEDVWAVFDRPDMIITPEQILDARINWEPKWKNVQSIAMELNLDLNSFIFIDDDSLQCAQMKQFCPTVLTLQLPSRANDIVAFLDSIWIFDTNKKLELHENRDGLYRQHAEREQLLKTYGNNRKEFLNSLNLNIEINILAEKECARAAELLLRTNQFNFSGEIIDEAEMVQKLNCDLFGISTSVEDRFGNYGLVGVALFQIKNGNLQVVNIVLSCRALGRGVEHKMVKALAEHARDRNLHLIELPFIPTSRNTPAAQFLRELVVFTEGSALKGDDSSYKFFRVQDLLNLEYSQILDHQDMLSSLISDTFSNPRNNNDIAESHWLPSDRYDLIAELSRDFDALNDRIEIHAKSRLLNVSPKRSEVYSAPRTKYEKTLCEIWQQVLGVERVGIKDNFFHMGGNSLLLIKLIGRMNNVGLDLVVKDVILNPTISGLLSIDKNLNTSQQYKYQEGDDLISIPNRQLLFRSTFQNHWNMTGIINIENANDVLLEKSLIETLSYQQGLLHRFYIRDGVVGEYIAPIKHEKVLELIDLSSFSGSKSAELESISAHLQSTLDMTKNLFKFVLFKFVDDEPYRFLWIIHHSLLDGYSESIFLEELFSRYLSYYSNIDYVQIPLQNSLADWGNYLHGYMNAESIAEDVKYWTSLPWAKVGSLIDYQDGVSRNQSGNRDLYGNDFVITKTLSRKHSQRLHQNRWQYESITTANIIFTAFVSVVSRLTNSPYVNFEMVINGRDKIVNGVDISRTVGWFIDYLPTLIEVDHDLSVYERVMSYAQQYSKIPSGGLSFNGLKYLNDDHTVRETFGSLPRAEFNINYIPSGMEVFQSDTLEKLPLHLLSLGAERPGESHGARYADIIWPSYIYFGARNGEYSFTWITRDNIYKESTIDLAMSLWMEEIEKITDALADDLVLYNR